MTIVYHGSVSATLRRIIEPRFEELAPYFPSWCETTYIYYNPEATDAVLECVPKYEYRTMSIIVSPLFIEDFVDWRRAIFHEMQHAVVRPYVAKAERIIEKFILDETVLDYIKDELVDAEESVVQDLAILACKLYKPVLE